MTDRFDTVYAEPRVLDSYASPREFDPKSDSSISSVSSVSSSSSVSSESSSITEFSSQSPEHTWSKLTGGDHGGGNWIPHNGDVVGGTHYNIGLFYLQPGYTITVSSHNRGEDADGPNGTLEISAERIVIAHGSTINGNGKGYTGGTTVPGHTGGDGPWGANTITCPSTPGIGPVPYLGGYAACNSNGDTSEDQDVQMGSGGAGSFFAVTGGSGGARILLWAPTSVTLEGTVTANGGVATGGPGVYSHGAGGGVLIWTNYFDAPGGVISVLGGGATSAVNPGTVKVFANHTGTSPSYSTGRIYLTQTEWETSSVSSDSSSSASSVSSSSISSVSSQSSVSSVSSESSQSSPSSQSSISTETLPSSQSSPSTQTSDSSISSVSSESSSSVSSISSSSVSSISSSSVSSESSISSISSPSSLSSQSSSSSDYGHLDAPTSLTLASVNPLTRTVTLTWTWSTLNHWGDPVTPTGFVVERQIGSDDYVVSSYSVLPNTPITNTSYSYGDVLTDADAAKVFALGYALSYRVRAYWVTP